MERLDKQTIAAGTPSQELMCRAGKAIAEYILNTVTPKRKTIILCGAGNNGGDGYVIGLILLEEGWDVTIVQIPSKKYSDDLRHYREKYLSLGGRCSELEEYDLKKNKESLLIIDALLGTGQNGDLRSPYDSIVAHTNANRSENDIVLAVDTPTGIDPTSGSVGRTHLKADQTVCIELLKRGLTQPDAREACGEILIAPIGIDTTPKIEFQLLDKTNIPQLNPRKRDAHKGHFDNVVILGGCREMPGAPILSGEAALRTGAGRATIIKPRGVPFFSAAAPELLWHEVGEQNDNHFLPQHLNQCAQIMEQADAIVVGPGIGRERETFDFLKESLRECSSYSARIIIDADALNAEILQIAPQERTIITPHPGEAARLLHTSTEMIQADRFLSLRKLHEEFGCLTLLKGAASLICCTEQSYVNSTGSPLLATPGSGDTLCGIIAALGAQVDSIEASLLLGVYIHGRIGEILEQREMPSIIARDIITTIPEALRETL